MCMKTETNKEKKKKNNNTECRQKVLAGLDALDLHLSSHALSPAELVRKYRDSNSSDTRLR